MTEPAPTGKAAALEEFQKAMAPTAIDRLVNYFSPTSGLERGRARAASAMMGNYSGAKRGGGVFKNWFTSHNDANADLLPDLPTLRSRCRDLIRNNPIASGAIETKVTNVVGSGLSMKSVIDHEFLGMTREEAKKWQKSTERHWKLFSESKNCDLSRTQNFAGLTDLAFRASLSNGDSFSLLPMRQLNGWPYKTAVQMIESDRVCNKDNKPDNKKQAGGILLDKNGAPSKLQYLTTHPGGYAATTRKWAEAAFFGARTGRTNVIHLFQRKRSGQLRGEPFLAPVIEPLKQIGRYTEAELMAAVVSGMFTVFVKTEDGTSLIDDEQIKEKTREYELGNGAIIEGIKGDSVEVINPGRPNTEFDPFVHAILKQVGVALELPFEVLMKAYVSSYSAARAALLDAWRVFKKRRKWLADNFCQPVYEAFLEECVASGRIHAPGFFSDPMIRKAYCKAQWHGDGPGAIDPLKEVNASEKRMKIGLTNLSEEKIAHDGGNWEDTVNQRKVEQEVIGESDSEAPPDEDEKEESFDPDNPQ